MGTSKNAESAATSSSSRPKSSPPHKRLRVRREDLLWKGILRADQLDRLKEISDFIVCPGYTGTFGSAADKWGRVYVPGATSGFKATRSTLLTWREKTANDERYNWWLEKLDKVAEKGIKAVRATDILEGVTLGAWRSYVGVYQKCSATRTAAKIKERQLREAALDAQEDKASDAAGALLSLVGPSKSSSDSTP